MAVRGGARFRCLVIPVSLLLFLPLRKDGVDWLGRKCAMPPVSTWELMRLYLKFESTLGWPCTYVE